MILFSYLDKAQHQQGRGSFFVVENIHTSCPRYRTLYDLSQWKYYVRSSLPSACITHMRVGLWPGGFDQPSRPGVFHQSAGNGTTGQLISPFAEPSDFLALTPDLPTDAYIALSSSEPAWFQVLMPTWPTLGQRCITFVPVPPCRERERERETLPYPRRLPRGVALAVCLSIARKGIL